MRSLSYTLINNTLVYYNPSGVPYDDPDSRESKSELARMESLAEQLADPEVNSQLKALSAALASLQYELPQTRQKIRLVNPGYSRHLPQIIDQQDQMRKRLTQLYIQQPPTRESQLHLNKLANDVERLLLSYQISAFPALGADLFILDDESVRALDNSIITGFEALKELDSGLAKRLDQPHQAYLFVRERILNQSGNWAPNAVGRYLVSVINESNLIARELDR